MQRKRDYEKKKAEADFDRRERTRLRLELLKDKLEKKTARGEPADPELLAQIAELSGVTQSAAAAAAAANPATARETLVRSLTAVAAFKSGGAGAKAASTLRTLVVNALEHPEEPKYRSVKLDNATIRDRLVAVTGSLAFLKAAGEVKSVGCIVMRSWCTDRALASPRDVDGSAAHPDVECRMGENR